MLPTTAQLPFAKRVAPPLMLPHRAVALGNVQRRLIGRKALVPVVDLDAYSFRVVIDWIEFRVHFNQTTQAQHVQQVLREFLDRNSFIFAKDEGPGRTFDNCTIKVQEPKNLAQITMIHRALCNRFGEAVESRVTGIEVSIDAYPARPSHHARATLLGALQRTIWTGRDIWWNPDSRPRTVFGKGEGSYYKLSPEPELEARLNKTKQNDELVTRLDPFHHRAIPIDGTMFLGAKYDDVMIRVMDKVIDGQRPDGTRTDLADDRKRVRIEVTVKGAELAEIGITSIPSLRTLKLTKFQKRYFQFRLPTFSCRDNPRTGADMLHNRKQIWRARTYLRSGLTGVMAMDAATKADQAKMKRRVRKTLRAMNLVKTRTWAGKRLAPPFSSWEQLNQKVHRAFRDLDRREATALSKVKC